MLPIAIVTSYVLYQRGLFFFFFFLFFLSPFSELFCCCWRGGEGRGEEKREAKVLVVELVVLGEERKVLVKREKEKEKE